MKLVFVLPLVVLAQTPGQSNLTSNVVLRGHSHSTIRDESGLNNMKAWSPVSLLEQKSMAMVTTEKEDNSTCALLQHSVDGSVFCNPSSTSYPFDFKNNLCKEMIPDIIVRPKSASDVSKTILIAKNNKVPLSVRSGGHSFLCNGFKDRGIHLDLRSMKARRVFHRNGEWFAKFETGNTFLDLFKTIPVDQFTFVHGECYTVGAGGYYLHGGAHSGGIQEKYGWGNSTVVSMDVVTADGQIRTLSDESADQPLWKAMRVAGSSFGVATSLTVRIWKQKVPMSWDIKTSLPMTTSNILQWMEAVPSLKIKIFPMQSIITAMSHVGSLRMISDLLHFADLVKALSVDPVKQYDESYYGTIVSTNSFISSNANTRKFIDVTLDAANALSKMETGHCYVLIKPFRYEATVIGPGVVNSTYLETTCWPPKSDTQLTKILRNLTQCYDQIDPHRPVYYNVPSKYIKNTDVYWGGNAGFLRSAKEKYDPDDVFQVYQGVGAL